jgi:hypothetical protein
MMVELHHQTQNSKEWKLRIEGKIIGQEKEEDILEGSHVNRFLNFFERVKVEFPEGDYPAVEWIKAKSENGSAFDCLEIVRNFTKDHLSRRHSVKVKLSFYLENNPKKYRLST